MLPFPLYWELCLLIVRKGKRGQNLFTHQRFRGIVGAGPADQRNATNDIILSNVAVMPPKHYGKLLKIGCHLLPTKVAIWRRWYSRMVFDPRWMQVTWRPGMQMAKYWIWKHEYFCLWQNWWILLHQGFHKIDPNITKSACYGEDIKYWLRSWISDLTY